MTRVWPTPDDYDSAAGDALAALSSSGVEARCVGSYAARTHQPPYSDLDILAIATQGEGAKVRDVVVEVARGLRETVCVTVDPFDRQAIVYSILDNGLQIDWFVAERDVRGTERPVWRGDQQTPHDAPCRAWSPLLYAIGVLKRDRTPAGTVEVARELGEHLVWLSLHGIDVSSLPALVPAADDDLLIWIHAIAGVLPAHSRLAAIVARRLEESPADTR